MTNKRGHETFIWSSATKKTRESAGKITRRRSACGKVLEAIN